MIKTHCAVWLVPLIACLTLSHLTADFDEWTHVVEASPISTHTRMLGLSSPNFSIFVKQDTKLSLKEAEV